MDRDDILALGVIAAAGYFLMRAVNTVPAGVDVSNIDVSGANIPDIGSLLPNTGFPDLSSPAPVDATPVGGSNDILDTGATDIGIPGSAPAATPPDTAGPSNINYDPMGNPISSGFQTVGYRIMPQSTLDNANVKAVLQLIRTGEGTLGDDGYTILFGGSHFDSFAAHPNTVIKSGNLSSTAAGAYQILYRTWNDLVGKYGYKDFSPPNQDSAAIALINQRGALDDVIAGRFATAIAKINKEWASMPGSPYGQPTLSLGDALQIIADNGGALPAGTGIA